MHLKYDARWLFILEVLAILLVSWLIFFVTSKNLAPLTIDIQKLSIDSEKFVKQFVKAPPSIIKLYENSYPSLLYSAEWEENGVRLSLHFWSIHLGDPKTSAITLEYFEELNNPISQTTVIKALENVVLDKQMLELLHTTPKKSSQKKDFPNGQKNGLKSIGIHNPHPPSISLVWYFDRNTIIDHFGLIKVAAKHDLPTRITNTIFAPFRNFLPREFLPFVVIPSIFMAGLFDPAIILYFGFYLIPSAVLVLFFSTAKPSLRSLFRLNVLFLVSLFMTTPLVSYVLGAIIG